MSGLQFVVYSSSFTFQNHNYLAFKRELKKYPADGLFMPITYLYRHCIELKLKALLRTIGECGLLEYEESLLTKHDLIKLWQAIKSALIEQWPKANRKPLSNVEALICDFHKIDKCGQKLRYPSTIEGQDVRGKYPKIVRLELLASAVDELCSLLDGCHAHFGLFRIRTKESDPD
jgi:hypothetical protein